MKKIIIYIIIAVFSFSCSDAFLKETPYSTLAPENYFNNNEEANAATLGIYNAFYISIGFRQFLIPLTESATDLFTSNILAGAGGRDLSDYLYNSQSSTLQSIWSSAYSVIGRANFVIDNMSRKDISVSDSAKLTFTGEAKFLRSLQYYYLVQLFGDVPLITSQTTSLDQIYVPRTSADQVWKQIISDLNNAVIALPEKSTYIGVNKSRASKGAARTLLAKVYMVRQDWQSALTQVNAIIDSKQYDLHPDIKTVFQVATENGLESIFEQQYVAGATPVLGSSSLMYFLPANVFTGWGTFFVSDSLINMYDKTSARYKTFFSGKGTFTDPTKTGSKPQDLGYPNNYFLLKFYDFYRSAGIVKGVMNNYEFNVRIFRYADVLLMKAECENEINGPNDAGVSAIQKVRTRAGEPLVYTTSNVGNKDNFRELIYKERAMELCGEGHRWFDLKRRGTTYMLQKINAVKALNSPPIPTVGEYQLLMPIPDSERQLNNLLTQNPGW